MIFEYQLGRTFILFLLIITSRVITSICHVSIILRSSIIFTASLIAHFLILTHKKEFMSHTAVLPSGCAMLYYMFDDQLFLRPQPAPDCMQSVSIMTILRDAVKRLYQGVLYVQYITRFHTTRVNGIPFTPVRTVRPTQHRLSLNSRTVCGTVCRCIIPNFAQID